MPSRRLVDVLDADIDQDVADDLAHVLIVVDNQHRRATAPACRCGCCAPEFIASSLRRCGASTARLKQVRVRARKTDIENCRQFGRAAIGNR